MFGIFTELCNVRLCKVAVLFVQQQSMYLRDVLDNMCSRKLRETTDFEWRRSVRCYMHPSGETHVWGDFVDKLAVCILGGGLLLFFPSF